MRPSILVPIIVKLRMEEPTVFGICDIIMKPIGIFKKSVFMAHFDGCRWSIIYVDSKGNVRTYMSTVCFKI